MEGAPAGQRRRRGLLLSVSFSTGIVLSLVALGVAASFAGRLFSRWSAAFAIGAAFFSFAAGLAAIFGPTIRQYVPDPDINKRGGIAGAFLYGLLYSVATVTTSAGPLLLLLTIAAAIGRPLYGAALSVSYAIGRALPFLLLGVFAGTVAAWLARMGRARRIAEFISGLTLVALSIYFAWLAHAIA